MKTNPQRRASDKSGIALIMVMLMTVVLMILAAGFAYTMKVETKLARNASVETDMEWLGRSGIELGRWILSIEGNLPGALGGVDYLKQYWAGGPGETNSPLTDLVWPYKLAFGEIDRPKITDCDRKFNLNRIDPQNPEVLREALGNVMGIDAGAISAIVDSILDWRDPRPDGHRPSGAKSETYQRMDPPYFCKDGSFDDLTELLLVQGVTPEMYWGSAAMGHTAMLNKPKASRSRFEQPMYEYGLKDLFTTSSTGQQINFNTAPAEVLRCIPGIFEQDAEAIVNGGAAGMGQMIPEQSRTEMPYRSVQDLVARVPQLANRIPQISPYFASRSSMFEVEVTVRAGSSTRTYIALVRRSSPRDTTVMTLSWK